ncbi:hypothetical protein NA57DRAFT_59782 [Rhizodiscina lignyota]|uniref:Zn(2)-C6 fungal-type domain-containing protein n=1 Tax=Rhizodiscina lignyota TaxID=1504668 RepID=A0A9P4I7R8_9PEZI|nr:hypothetical protein NA57DRAFT_59782 [Rhizodiscina lignyota]
MFKPSDVASPTPSVHLSRVFDLIQDYDRAMQRPRPRQDPVSCQLCRSKKLKCDRRQPCSNCVARGVTCKSQNSTDAVSTATEPLPDNAKILERLKRLEDAVFGANGSDVRPSRYPGKNALHDRIPILKLLHQYYQVFQHNIGQTMRNFANIRILLLVTQDSEPSTKRVALTPVSDQGINNDLDLSRQEEAHKFELLGTREDSELPCLSNVVVFRIQSIPEILRGSTASNQYGRAFTGLPGSSILVSLPTQAEAVYLLRCYGRDVDPLVRVSHVPSSFDLLNDFYMDLNRSQQVQPGKAAFLLAMFALTAYFWRSPSNNEIVSLTEDEMILLALTWSKAALDALDYSRRTTSFTLEDAQASIIMSFVVYHIEGFSARGRWLTATAASIAKDLSLHRIDEEPLADNSKKAFIEREVKRRVWWHITATDWLLAFIGGPQEGSYSIQPRQMQVNLPLDCDDDQLSERFGTSRSASVGPTSMSYFLQRVRLAELSREIIDTIPLPISRLKTTDYDQILALDRKLVTFLEQLPDFLRVKENAQPFTPPDSRYPHLPMMRYYVNVTLHSRRCRLHQPFLIRQGVDPRYEYSRRVCLESARLIIRIQRLLTEAGPRQPNTQQVTTCVVHFAFFAIVVTVMDLCFNRIDGDDAARLTEVMEACKMMEEAKSHSPLAGKFLSSLLETLQKYNIRLPQFNHQGEGHARGVLPARPHEEAAIAAAPTQNTVQSSAFTPTNMQFEPSLDYFFDTTSQGSRNLDMPSWDQLFSDIDTQGL